jgi:hypothetical protein
MQIDGCSLNTSAIVIPSSLAWIQASAYPALFYAERSAAMPLDWTLHMNEANVSLERGFLNVYGVVWYT